jgi:16S rRNA (cytidine1402-2'-O)-methyltransferase
MNNVAPVVYLIPSPLDEEAIHTIPPYVTDAVKDCQVFFVENERTARRYLKKTWKEMVIDDYEWFDIGKKEAELQAKFKQKLKEGKNIGIISEAGCPGVADPGQRLIALAHETNAIIKPLVGPGSILLALMASGMNGQRFQFSGYLPIDAPERGKTIRDLESESQKKNCTQIFIETPYRNNQILESILKNCKPETRFCIAVDLTGDKEWVHTGTIAQWQQDKPDLHKRPAIFLLYAGA